jgi:hypothetical protein
MSHKKQTAMMKSPVGSVVSEIGRRAEELPARLMDARRTLSEWGGRTRRFVRKNPGTVVIGAFAVGFVLAKMMREV